MREQRKGGDGGGGFSAILLNFVNQRRSSIFTAAAITIEHV